MPMPEVSRRGFGLGAIAASLIPASLSAAPAEAELKPMTGGVLPIGREERLSRIVRAQDLMRRHGLGSILVEPGSSLDYFTGVQWWRSERLTAALIPAEGRPILFTPFFEEPSVRESLGIPAEVRTWVEHEDPMAKVVAALRDLKLQSKPVGIEETVRFFIVDGLRKSGAQIGNGAPVVRGCRMIKSPAEIALMRKASDITIAAFRYASQRVEKGISPSDIDALIGHATRAMGGEYDGGLVLIGEASAYPHGSHKPQIVGEGEVVLLDCGCSVHGYQSDISRSFVFGEPSAEQRKVWNQVRRGQQIAFAAAQVGKPCGSVDDAVRGQYEAWGYGPGYKLPGTSHRTGHGIGMDGHEPVNLVHGEATLLAPGMCFSDEPGIYIPGKFGIRLEDCFYMTAAGPRWFSEPPNSIDKPFG